MPVRRRFLGPTNQTNERSNSSSQMINEPISEPRTKPDTEIPRVAHATRKRPNINIKYEEENDVSSLGPNVQRQLERLIKMKLILIIGRRPYLK
jgi:hypothetical protein